MRGSLNGKQLITLEVNDLHVYRRKRHILKGISCHAVKGQVLGLIGANGSGKSTLLKTILNILPKESGSVLLDKRNIDEFNRTSLARRMAYMAQENECRWPLTVERVVALGRMPHQAPWQSFNENDQSIVNDVMQIVGIDHLSQRTITRLSGGERHRVLFARALASEPEVLLADEPTAGLDPYHQLHLMELFQQQADAGKTVIVVLHDLTHASRFCDKLVLLKDGVVLDQGIPEEVLSEDNLIKGYGINAQKFLNEGKQTIIPWKCAT